ncbi:MAG: phosphate signaling complex protein PhoU [Clostridiaceae bacterium]|jgi:phosphate transport system protein|nr:phosphate signaling complex protein PhoU [Clostridiaceae bacterium]
MTSRQEFQNEIRYLHEQIIRMGAAVEKALTLATDALFLEDGELAKQVIAGDDLIDEQEREIDRQCVRLIALQQPVARDLRDVTSNLKLITDLERVADHAVEISGYALNLQEMGNTITIPPDLIRLAELTRQILRAALDSYVSRDKTKAALTIQMEQPIDEIYQKVSAGLIEQMKNKSGAMNILAELLLVSKNFERAAAHAQNVAEWVIYYIDGRHAHYLEEEGQLEIENDDG